MLLLLIVLGGVGYEWFQSRRAADPVMEQISESGLRYRRCRKIQTDCAAEYSEFETLCYRAEASAAQEELYDAGNKDRHQRIIVHCAQWKTKLRER